MRAVQPAASSTRPWCSICTPSSKGCATRAATKPFAARRSNATSRSTGLRTPCLRVTARALLTPCSADTFRIIYGDAHPHHGCQGNFEKALRPYGISADQLPVAFNIFMNVVLDASTGEITVMAPRSKAGDYIMFAAETDLIVALTACSAPQSNNGSFKPIDFEVGQKRAT